MKPFQLLCLAVLLVFVSGCVVEVNDATKKEPQPAPKEPTEKEPKKPVDLAPKRPWQPRKTPPVGIPKEPEPTPTPTEPPQPAPVNPPAPEPAPQETPEITATEPAAGNENGKPLPREINVLLAAYRYTPDKIVVASGDFVRLKLTSNSDGLGNGIGYKVEGLPVDVIGVKKGETKTVEFTAGMDGTYVIFCGSACGPRAQQKMGEIIVVGR